MKIEVKNWDEIIAAQDQATKEKVARQLETDRRNYLELVLRQKTQDPYLTVPEGTDPVHFLDFDELRPEDQERQSRQIRIAIARNNFPGFSPFG